VKLDWLQVDSHHGPLRVLFTPVLALGQCPVNYVVCMLWSESTSLNQPFSDPWGWV